MCEFGWAVMRKPQKTSADCRLVNNAGGAVGTEKAGDVKLEDIDFMVNTNCEWYGG